MNITETKSQTAHRLNKEPLHPDLMTSESFEVPAD